MRDKQLFCASIKWTGKLAEIRDDPKGKHVERVQRYFEILLKKAIETEMYKSEAAAWDVEAMLLASALHDVGKIMISDSILLKRSRLNPREFEDMQKHCIFGKALLEDMLGQEGARPFVDYAINIAYYHHEKWDGTGYPEGLKGSAIPLEARIMALVDVYDALVSERPYKLPYSHENAMEIIQEGSATHFEPALVELFVSLSDEIKS